MCGQVVGWPWRAFIPPQDDHVLPYSVLQQLSSQHTVHTFLNLRWTCTLCGSDYSIRCAGGCTFLAMELIVPGRLCMEGQGRVFEKLAETGRCVLRKSGGKRKKGKGVQW
jgi:hypothetical protein